MTDSSDSTRYDLVVIGGGPAGYVGAIRAGQLGMRVACVERDALGGVCLNWGCIPTKALLAVAEFYRTLQHDAGDFGITAGEVGHDWPRVIARSREVAGTLSKGISGLFKKNKVEHIPAHAKIVAADDDGVTIEIHEQPGVVARTIRAGRVVIATGAEPRTLPGVEIDGEKVLSSKQAMIREPQPEKLVIIGAGAIGMEFAYFYNAFGTQVTVIEMLDSVLPNEDAEVSQAVARSFKKQGVTCRTGTRTMGVDSSGEGVRVTVAPRDDESRTETVEADCVLMAIGVQGRYDGLCDDSLGLTIDRHHITVDPATFQTNLPHVYAVGDVIGPPWLAHVAMHEAVVCVEQLAGRHVEPVNYHAIPACTYCLPQVASIGKTEQQLKEQGLTAGEDYHVGKFPFLASGKARALGNTDGFVKLLTDAKYGEILGVHMVGEHVTELLAELGLAIKLEATPDEIIETIHAHPTLSEAVHEAALGTEDRTLHV